MTRAVLFDVDGVLVHSRFHADEAARRYWDEHLLADMGVEPSRFQALFDPSFERVLTGQKSLVAALDEFLPTVGYRGSTMDFIGYWIARDSHLNFQLLEVIKQLRSARGVRLYVATNQEHIRATYLWNELKLRHLFDDMFYAARFGAAKPNPEFFRRAEAFIGPLEQPPLLFDDSAEVIAAANAHGWEGVLFTDVTDCSGHSWIAERLSIVK
ncbi:HAD-IA family hydrolase [Devosia sp. ZB163]|uniref:HAD family hydrolase n=1 Tax=Devosia sp. ZB163 TaxID=3025938 RepID=UPI0023622F9A|nr:HAD-IA family hydrolase [Devosia sp. ZB163]MDC9824475.1 HAD-IA family hydrolase [Devosia sp. ZB163]